MFNTDASDTPIGVVGAGAMGAGIAEVAASAGHPVYVADLGPDALRRGRELVAASLGARETGDNLYAPSQGFAA